MSISVYSGLMGSGKSYEAVKSSLLPAIRKGRRVVTNISGVSQSAIHDLLVNEGLDRDKLGLILIVSNERVLEPSFFPGEAAVSFKFEVPEWVPLPHLQFYAEEYVLHQGKNFTRTIFQLMLPDLKRLRDGGFDIGSCLVTAATREWKTLSFEYFQSMPRGEVFAELPDSGPSVVEAGDLVIIDEAWRYWAEDTKLTAEHMNFFRMHRHYVDEKGVCCDLVVLIQDFGSLHRFLRRVCELVLIFYKLKALGLMSRYRVEVYEGRPRRASLISTSPWQKYSKKIFPLYKSYDGVAGKESVVDDRQNLFKNKWFLAVMIVSIVGFVWGGTFFINYIARMRAGGDPDKPVVGQTSLTAGSSPSQVSTSGTTSAPQASPSTVAMSGQVSAPELRLVGIIEAPSGETLALIQYQDGRLIRQRMNAGVVDGWDTQVGHQGRMVGFNFVGKGK